MTKLKDTFSLLTVFAVLSIPANLYNLISLLNNSCIKLDAHNMVLENYSEALEYINMNNINYNYMIEDIIETFELDDCFGYCNYVEPCNCTFIAHSKIKSDLLFKISLDNYKYNVPNINYIIRYNNLMDSHYNFEEQIKNFNKLKEYNLGFYYKNFPSVFNKYNNFDNKHLIEKYDYFSDELI